MELSKLYGELDDYTFFESRIENIKNTFFKNEGCYPTHIFSSSGRAEILGNHTDHNNGLVMVATISCDIVAGVCKSDDNFVKIYSLEYQPVVVNLNELEVNSNEYGTSNALVKGIAKSITQKGYKINGFTAYTTSNIFKGAGVSSSAAFEVLVAEIFNTLYLDGKLTDIDKAIISKYAENVYFLKPCGLLDQSGIAIGSLISIDFIDTDYPTITKLNPPKNYSIVITNTGGDHSTLTNHYASIKNEMQQIASHFNKKVLREVDYSLFIKEIPLLTKKYSSRAILRALHFYRENQRVLRAVNCLQVNDTPGFLEEINQSGLSSLSVLQNCYVPTETNQPVVLGIELSREFIKNGAVRVHGGGFAGSIIAFVENSEVDNYICKMQEVFGTNNVFKANIRNVGTTLIK